MPMPMPKLFCALTVNKKNDAIYSYLSAVHVMMDINVNRTHNKSNPRI